MIDFYIQYNITISNTFSTILCSSTYLIYVSIEVSVSTQQQKMGALNFQQAIGTYRLSSDGGGGTYKAEPCNDCTQNSTSSCGCRKGKFVLSTSTAARLFPAFHQYYASLIKNENTRIIGQAQSNHLIKSYYDKIVCRLELLRQCSEQQKILSQYDMVR